MTFEDLIAWQKARALTGAVYAATRQGGWEHDFGLANQIRRAAVSIMSNIAEGNERGSATEYHQFLCIAKGSCAEVRSQLYVALDAGYLADQTFRGLLEQAQEVSRIVGGLRAAIDRKRSHDTGKAPLTNSQPSALGSQP
jgi:four helix bundle protein